MSVLGGDYIGFSYNGQHSSDLGIVRTSNGSRFDENLLPTMQDKTVQVPGGDGTYYFGSYYTQQRFSVSFAFDSLTETQVSNLKSLFGDKKVHDLIFDERPYKVYRAKVSGTATIKHLVFNEGIDHRLYKGEGTIQFVCYQPYARSNMKWLDEYQDWDNVDEWKEASGLKQSAGVYDVVANNSTIPLWNPGDIETNFTFKINFREGAIPRGGIAIRGDSTKQLLWNRMSAQSGDAFVKIDTKLNLIEGYNSSGMKTGNIYNSSIITGDFFKIPKGESIMDISEVIEHLDNSPIDYYYYYF